MSKNEKHEMTVREAGKKGGKAVKEKHGPEYYSRIGKKGGKTSGKGHEAQGPEGQK